MAEDKKTTRQTAAQQREARLAENLRANLRRRKAAARKEKVNKADPS